MNERMGECRNQWVEYQKALTRKAKQILTREHKQGYYSMIDDAIMHAIDDGNIKGGKGTSHIEKIDKWFG